MENEKFVTRVDSLTEEQEAAMPAYAQKWIEIGLRTGETDWDTFDRYFPICYEKAGLKYPARVVRVQSPLVGALASSVAEGILKKRCGAVRDAVGGAVDDAVGGAVDDAVGGAVRGAVRDVVDDAVRGAVDDAVGGAVRGAVRDVVDGAVRDVVDDAVGGAISIAKKAGVTLSWHYWLGGQFWVGGWWYLGVAFAGFFFDACKLKLSKDIMERAEAYRKVCESVNYIWPNRDFVMVCARPTKIVRNQRGQLHNEHGKAIEYPDGWGLYVLNGVRFPEELYLKVISREMPMSEIQAIVDIDQRTQAMKFAKEGIREFYISQNGKKIDEHVKFDIKGRMVKYELWELPKGDTFTQTVHFCLYDCPSAQERGEKREYSKGTPVELNTVAESMAWGMSNDENVLTPADWKKLVPLEHEA